MNVNIGTSVRGHQVWSYILPIKTVRPQVALAVKNPPANAGDLRDTGLIPGSEDLLEEEMAPHSSILAGRISWTEEPGGLQSMGSQRVRHDEVSETAQV